MSAKVKTPPVPRPKGLPKRKAEAAQEFINSAGQTERHTAINQDINKSINTEVPPIKVMFTIPPEQADGLGVLQSKLRSLVGPARRGQVNRSVIVRAALEMFAGDFEKNGDQGEGYRLIDILISR